MPGPPDPPADPVTAACASREGGCLNGIRFVLVRPTHPGNIGGVARAMKNMGLRHLSLVAPEASPADAEALARAAGAVDVLEQAVSHSSLAAAVADCALVLGTSARHRYIEWPLCTPEQAAREVLAEAGKGRVAILFGQERTGLTNEEVEVCDSLVTIPCDPSFSSLNLVCAVQVIAYEIYRAVPEQPPRRGARDTPLASHAERRHFYHHLQQVITDIGFLRAENPRKLMRRLIRLFTRARLDVNEVNMLRGILSAVGQGRANKFDKNAQ